MELLKILEISLHWKEDKLFVRVFSALENLYFAMVGDGEKIISAVVFNNNARIGGSVFLLRSEIVFLLSRNLSNTGMCKIRTHERVVTAL